MYKWYSFLLILYVHMNSCELNTRAFQSITTIFSSLIALLQMQLAWTNYTMRTMVTCVDPTTEYKTLWQELPWGRGLFLRQLAPILIRNTCLYIHTRFKIRSRYEKNWRKIKRTVTRAGLHRAHLTLIRKINPLYKYITVSIKLNPLSHSL